MVSTDVAPVAEGRREIANPNTGELIDLDTVATNDIALLVDESADERAVRARFERALKAELLERLDKAAKRSFVAGDYKLEAGQPKVWDTDETGLRAALLKLVAEDRLAIEAVDAAVPKETIVKAKRSGLKMLHEHADERVRTVVGDYDRRVENTSRTVRISRVVQR